MNEHIKATNDLMKRIYDLEDYDLEALGNDRYKKVMIKKELDNCNIKISYDPRGLRSQRYVTIDIEDKKNDLIFQLLSGNETGNNFFCITVPGNNSEERIKNKDSEEKILTSANMSYVSKEVIDFIDSSIKNHQEKLMKEEMENKQSVVNYFNTKLYENGTKKVPDELTHKDDIKDLLRSIMFQIPKSLFIEESRKKYAYETEIGYGKLKMIKSEVLVGRGYPEETISINFFDKNNKEVFSIRKHLDPEYGRYKIGSLEAFDFSITVNGKSINKDSKNQVLASIPVKDICEQIFEQIPKDYEKMQQSKLKEEEEKVQKINDFFNQEKKNIESNPNEIVVKSEELIEKKEIPENKKEEIKVDDPLNKNLIKETIHKIRDNLFKFRANKNLRK